MQPSWRVQARQRAFRTGRALLAALAAASFGCGRASAAEPAGVFSRGAVLQRDAPVPVWGSGAAGEKVSSPATAPTRWPTQWN
jgi:hypothetical protein